MPGLLVGPGEVIANQLYTGPGAEPMLAAAEAYSTLGEAMSNGAANSDGTMDGMQNIWKGHSANRAQTAFRNHSTWVRKQALNAFTAASQAAMAADAFSTTQASTPPPETFTALRATITALAASPTAVSSPALIGATTALVAMNIQAIAAYGGYSTEMTTILGGLPDIPVPAPTITSGPSFSGSGPQGPGPGPGPGSGPVGSGPSSSPGSNPGNTTTPGNTSDPGSNPGSGPTQSNPDPGGQTGTQQPGGDTGNNPTGTDPQQPTNVQDSVPSQDLGGPNGLSGDPGNFPDSTSYSNSDLAGLGGGLAAYSMARGGLGSMPGAATGFRMPANWGQLTGGRAFGAGTGLAEPEAAPQRRGVTAPEMQRRRKRKEEKERKAAKVSGKVFIPGELDEVPELEQPPAIGVLEYDLDPLWDELTDEDEQPTVGVIERVEDDFEPAPERPR